MNACIHDLRSNEFSSKILNAVMVSFCSPIREGTVRFVITPNTFSDGQYAIRRGLSNPRGVYIWIKINSGKVYSDALLTVRICILSAPRILPIRIPEAVATMSDEGKKLVFKLIPLTISYKFC